MLSDVLDNDEILDQSGCACCGKESRSGDETMTAVHKGAADEVSKVETHVGVCNVKPNCAGV